MITKITIAVIALFVVVGIASAAEWQPSWAPEPIPLVPGQEYRTGSPLSKPGLFGLFGSIFESTYGGQQFKGGGTVLYTGSGSVDTTSYTGGATQPPQAAQPSCPSITVNGETFCTYQTLDAARAAQQAAVDTLPTPTNADASASLSENKPHAVVPICEAPQRLHVFHVPDETLGVRLVYTCK